MLDGFLALATPNIITYENANNYEFLFSCHCYSVWWIISESTMRFHYRWRFSLPVCPSISTSSTCWPGTFWPGMAPAAATSSHPWLPPQTPDQLNKQLIPCKGLMVSESWPQINCNLPQINCNSLYIYIYIYIYIYSTYKLPPTHPHFWLTICGG